MYIFQCLSFPGAVIKAWDMAVATMTKGEVCVVQCIAKYGYGKRGSKPKIPPDATLVFEIELIDWRGIVESLLLVPTTLKISPLHNILLNYHDYFPRSDFCFVRFCKIPLSFWSMFVLWKCYL